MRPLPGQLDLFDHDPARLARAYRDAADQALRQGDTGHFSARERYDTYIAEAERLEALAAMTKRDAA